MVEDSNKLLRESLHKSNTCTATSTVRYSVIGKDHDEASEDQTACRRGEERAKNTAASTYTRA